MHGAAVGLRELRQQASELVRRAEAGEVVVVTVNGRPAARLVPPQRAQWRRLAEMDALFAGPDEDDTWHDDLARLDASPDDPWARP